MSRFPFAATLAASAIVLVAPASGAQTADAAIDRAVAAYGKMDTFRATFEQKLTNPLTGSTMVAQGEVQRRKPNLIAVRFTDPAGDRIVIDGKAIWMYLPSTNPGQAYKMPMAAGGAGAFDPVQLMESPRTRYEITDGGATTLGDRRVHLVTLVPKSADAPFAAAKVWIDSADGLIRQFEVREASGLTRHIRLLTMQANAAIPASAFTFTPPRGVQVVDQTKMR